MDDEELDCEPEACIYCEEMAEEAGVEYEFNYSVQDGLAYCDDCGGVM